MKITDEELKGWEKDAEAVLERAAAIASVTHFQQQDLADNVLAGRMIDLIKALREERERVKDLEDINEDKRRIVREFDLWMNGERAAKQASLIDVLAQAQARLGIAVEVFTAISWKTGDADVERFIDEALAKLRGGVEE